MKIKLHSGSTIVDREVEDVDAFTWYGEDFVVHEIETFGFGTRYSVSHVGTGYGVFNGITFQTPQEARSAAMKQLRKYGRDRVLAAIRRC